jgi:hypothetical protein
MNRVVSCAFAVLVAGLLAGVAAASAPVGRVVGARGQVEVARGNETWAALPVGSQVFAGDHLRTREGGIVKILFDDESVADVGGADAEVEVVRYDTDPAATEPRTLLRVKSGTLVVRRSEFYAEERWRYEIETPTAITRAQPGKVLIRHELRTGATDVVCYERGAQVRGVLGVIGPGVDLAAGQFTRVQKGQFPTPPETLDAEALAAQERGLVLVGTGERDGLDAGNPLVAGQLLREEDRLGAATARAATGSYLNPDRPGETLQDQLSPDMRVHTQPLLEFKRVPPGQPPTGGVEVPF